MFKWTVTRIKRVYETSESYGATMWEIVRFLLLITMLTCVVIGLFVGAARLLSWIGVPPLITVGLFLLSSLFGLLFSTDLGQK